MSILDLNKMDQGEEYDKSKEEVLERTNPEKGEFSPSSLGYAQCLRKYYFEKIVKLQGNYPQYPLIFGSAIHCGVEYFYKNIMSDEPFEAVRAKAQQAFVKEWAKWKVPGDDKRNMGTGITLVGMYCDRYRHEDVLFKTTEVEGSQWINMPNGTMLLCKMDRVVDRDGLLAIVDTKTSTGYLNERFFRGFVNQLQTSLYHYTMEKILGRCDYILIDAIHVPVLGERSSAEQFARRSFTRTDEQIEEAVRTYCRKTDYLMEGMNKGGKDRLDHFYCDQNRCNDYSGCPYLGVCQHGPDHPMVGVNYKFATDEHEEKFRRDFG